MKNTEISVTGNKYLLKAFEQELLDNGFKRSDWEVNYEYLYYRNDNNCVLHGRTTPSSISYSLPSQYDEAKDAFYKLIKPKTIQYNFASLDNTKISASITKDKVEFTIDDDTTNSFTVGKLQIFSLVEDIDKVNNHKMSYHKMNNWNVKIDTINIGCQNIFIADILYIHHSIKNLF